MPTSFSPQATLSINPMLRGNYYLFIFLDNISYQPINSMPPLIPLSYIYKPYEMYADIGSMNRESILQWFWFPYHTVKFTDIPVVVTIHLLYKVEPECLIDLHIWNIST